MPLEILYHPPASHNSTKSSASRSSNRIVPDSVNIWPHNRSVNEETNSVSRLSFLLSSQRSTKLPAMLRLVSEKWLCECADLDCPHEADEANPKYCGNEASLVVHRVEHVNPSADRSLIGRLAGSRAELSSSGKDRGAASEHVTRLQPRGQGRNARCEFCNRWRQSRPGGFFAIQETSQEWS